MTKAIWKFAFDTADEVDIELPGGAEILAVQVQQGQPCLWALVDPSEPLKAVRFRIYGTGHPIPTYGAMDHIYGKYVGTYQMRDGHLVFHMFRMGGPV